ncbi:hypothetical protein [Campylobacter concisus]|uniref:hypothetical protein n=1 Tax=Campylobacter concisus TaxID=199 RepID=UPI003D1D55E2
MICSNFNSKVFKNLDKASGINLIFQLNLLTSKWINLRIFKFRSQNFKFYFEISSFIF